MGSIRSTAWGAGVSGEVSGRAPGVPGNRPEAGTAGGSITLYPRVGSSHALRSATHSRTTSPDGAAGLLLEDFSLDMTGKDVPALEEAGQLLPGDTRVNVTFLGNGFEPVPHVSARRLPSRAAFEEFLSRLRADGTSGQVFAVGGDPAVPEGPYGEALALIRSGLLERYGVRQVGVCGYPEGHPVISSRSSASTPTRSSDGSGSCVIAASTCP